jgi:hypothetical protein
MNGDNEMMGGWPRDCLGLWYALLVHIYSTTKNCFSVQ